MADAITIKALQDASLDAKSLEEVVNGGEEKQVTTRLGESYPSVKKAIKTLFENGGIAGRFKTLTELQASSLVDGDYALVADDTDDNNGIYIKEGGAWVKSRFNNPKVFKLYYTKVDKVDFTEKGYFKSDNGEFVENVSYNATDFIPVSSGDTYSVNVSTTAASACVFYDSKKQFLGTFANNSRGDKEIIIPTDVSYVRLCNQTNNTSPYLVPADESIPTPHIATRQFVQSQVYNDQKVIDAIKERVYDSSYFSINGRVYGDGSFRDGYTGFESWYRTDRIPVSKGETVEANIVNESTKEPVAIAFYNSVGEMYKSVIVESPTKGLKVFSATADETGYIATQHAAGGEGVSSVIINKDLSRLISTQRLAEIVKAGLQDSQSKIKQIATGSYSWWNEPCSLQYGEASPLMFVGSAGFQDGWHKSTQVNFSNSNSILTAYGKSNSDYKIDEHNSPVIIVARDKAVMFYTGHNNENILNYRCGSGLTLDTLGNEVSITPDVGQISYAQAFYNKPNDTVYVLFRAASNSAWFIAQSSDWDSDSPNWDVHKLVSSSYQMYVRAVPTYDGNELRLVITYNAKHESVNGLWFGLVNLTDMTLRASDGTVITNITESDARTSSLEKIYSSSYKMRLYDAKTEDSVIPILIQEITTEDVSGMYKYLEFDITSGAITKEVDIVDSGESLGYNNYFGGVHFCNVTAMGNSLGKSDTYTPIYLSRNNNGEWLLEEWITSDSGTTWQVSRVIDSSTTEKIWRPRVPFDSVLYKDVPNKVLLTWCKGSWSSYTNYDSKIYALTY